MSRGKSEPFLFSLLLVFLVLTFVGQWPLAAREAFLANDASVYGRMMGRALAVLATIPFWYGLAAFSHLLARLAKGQGSWYSARLALFWALATVSPLMLLQGLVAGMIGPGPALTLVNAVVGLGFFYLWINMLVEGEK